MMTVQQALAFIEDVSWVGSKLGLSRTEELLQRIGNPEKQLNYIHVAGTNGKGSTAAILASVLREAGFVTGLYTSPYLYRYQERIRVNGAEISDEELSSIVEFLQPAVAGMTDRPTEFEMGTCIAFEHFHRKHCDIVVLEVGLGGKLDSTNVIKAPEVAVITNIGLDHMAQLGNTVEEIARTKGGIIKQGCPTVIYPQKASVMQVLEEICVREKSKLVQADFSKVEAHHHDFDGQVFSWNGLSELTMPLLGSHQLNNAAVALTAIYAMREKGWSVSEAAIRNGLSNVSWPGRFEVLSRNPVYIMDGGHNPQCVDALVNTLRDYCPNRNMTFLVGVLADKDYAGMFEKVAPLAERFITVTPNSPRALPGEELKQYLSQYGKPTIFCESMEAGVETALAEAGPSGVICAFGSLYMVGAARHYFLDTRKN